MDGRVSTTSGRGRAMHWDTPDGRLAQLEMALRQRSATAWTLDAPRPAALGPTSPIVVGGGDQPPAELVEVIWPFVAGDQLRPVEHTDPPTPAPPASGHLDLVVQQAVDEVIAALPWLRLEGSDPTAIRVGRTAVRRLRTHLRSVRSLVDGPPAMWDGLGLLNEQLRDVRNLDIVAQVLPPAVRQALIQESTDSFDDVLKGLFMKKIKTQMVIYQVKCHRWLLIMYQYNKTLSL